MVVTIELKPEVEAVLEKRAAAQGRDLGDYVQQLIEKEARSPQTLDEILAPFRQEVEESGMSDEELDEFFTDARRKVFQARQGRKRK
ncbi:MAG: hypothetical protein L0229_01130 [Blastocatellia bacterium]|nr:hypothetical protein [Blastocatellia bacterium]